MALGFGDGREILFPHVREDRARALLIEPANLFRPAQEDAAQNERAHARGMRLGVGERKRTAPRAAEHLPTLDLQMLAQPLDVLYEMPRRILFEARVRRALARTALINKHDAVSLWIEEATIIRHCAAAGAAV